MRNHRIAVLAAVVAVGSRVFMPVLTFGSDDCNWQNGAPVVGSGVVSQWAPENGVNCPPTCISYFSEAADNFTLETNSFEPACCVSDIRLWVKHSAHNGDCQPGGTAMCQDNPNDYTNILVTIYGDNGLPPGGGQAPAGQPSDEPPDGTHSGIVRTEIVVPGPSRSTAPPIGEAWYEFTTLGDPADSIHEIVIHLNDPFGQLLESSRLKWLAIAPEVNRDGFYETLWLQTGGSEGNPAHASSTSTANPTWNWTPLDADLAFEIIGLPVHTECVCFVDGDVFPPPDLFGQQGDCSVDIDDILYELVAFADGDPCTNFPGSNLFPCGQACAAGAIDIDDLLSVLAAFAGQFECFYPFYGGACCYVDGDCICGTPESCEAEGAIFQGAGMFCAADLCE